MKQAFLNVGIGLWFSRGSERLRQSLIDHNFPGDRLIWKDEWPNSLRMLDRNMIYNCKPDAFQTAINAGYSTIIWGDSSIYAVKDVNAFVDKINAKGYWIGQSGYNAAQTCNDRCLKYFGLTRDQAEKIPDCATGLFGVNLGFPPARQFIERWIQAAKDGIYAGSRVHDGICRDHRFRFHRQDQSAATCILAQLGMKLDEMGTEVAFAWDETTGQTFHCEGM